MPSLILVLLFFSFSSFAKVQDCYKQELQSDKAECMAFERDKAIGKLMSNLTQECAQKSGIESSEGNPIYPMLLDECMTDEILELAKRFDR